MLTMAEILEMGVGNNLCKVRIPILEPAGNKKQVTIWATMTLPPGIHGGYEVGDVVFISFADNTLNKPVVLGQLYKGGIGNKMDSMGNTKDTFDRASEFECTKLTTINEAYLPAASTHLVGTQEDYNTIGKLINIINSLSEKVTALETRVKALEPEPEPEPKGWLDALVDTLTGNTD